MQGVPDLGLRPLSQQLVARCSVMSAEITTVLIPFCAGVLLRIGDLHVGLPLVSQ